jgi:hypothetical protein
VHLLAVGDQRDHHVLGRQQIQGMGVGG